MKEERIPSRHALLRSPGQAYFEYMKEKMRSNRRIFTRMSFEIEICPVFRRNDLLALTLNRLCHSAWGSALGERALPISVTRDA